MLFELQGSPTTPEAQIMHILSEHQISGKKNSWYSFWKLSETYQKGMKTKIEL